MRHLRRIIPTAILAAAMLVAVNFVSTPRTFADGPYDGGCASWVTQYRTQLVQGAPRWVLRTDFYGIARWQMIPTRYYAQVPVQVCVSYVTVVTPTNVIYPTFVYPSVFDGNYFRFGYTTGVGYYGPYRQPNGLNYLAPIN